MRWFKHMTQTRTDEKIADLIDKCGIEGYGFYWAVLEIIANVMDKTDRCEVTYSLSKWSSLLGVHHHKVNSIFSVLGGYSSVTPVVTPLVTSGLPPQLPNDYPPPVTTLMIVSNLEGNLTVKVPNLLKYRDEWASRKSTTRESHPSDSRVTRELYTETEAETEEELKKRKKKKKNLSSKLDLSLSSEASRIFEFWKVTMGYEKSQIDAKRKKSIEDALSLGYSSGDICEAISGCLNDGFSMGANDRNKVYNDISLICRDATHIDKFMKIFKQQKFDVIDEDAF